MKRAMFMLASLALLLGGAGQARAELTITFSQAGPDVVANGVGSLNFLDLSFQGFDFNGPAVDASAGTVVLGPTGSYADYYGAISGPTSFGSGGNVFAAFGTSTAPGGTGAGVDGATGQLLVPGGYGANDPFTVSATWTNTTISALGLTAGTYTWTWGSGANADSLVVIIPAVNAVPEPSTAVVGVMGGVAFLAYGWSRLRRVSRQQAAA